MEPTQPKPIANWNTARDVWETPQTEGLFCEHLDVYSETFPTSGMTVNGVAYALPTWEPHTVDSGSSSLLRDAPQMFRTPCAAEAAGGPRDPNRPGATMRLSDQVREETQRGKLLKTPTSQLAVNGGSQHPDKRKQGGHGPTLADEVEHLLPTPAANEPGFTLAPVDKHGNPPEHGAQRWYHPETGRLLQKGVSQVIANLLPTPRAQNGEDRNQKIWARDKSQPQNLENALAATLPGASTNQRSDAGNQLWEDVPLPLPNPQDATVGTA